MCWKQVAGEESPGGAGHAPNVGCCLFSFAAGRDVQKGRERRGQETGAGTGSLREQQDQVQPGDVGIRDLVVFCP